MRPRAVLPILFLPALAPLLAPAPGNAAGDAYTGGRLAASLCSQCHVIDGTARGRDTAVPLPMLARSPRASPEYLRGFLARPHGGMPPYSFTRDEIENLIAYLETLK